MLKKHWKAALLCCGLVALSACETSRRDNAISNDDASIFLEIKQPVDLQQLHAERPGDAQVNALLASQKSMPDQEVRLVQARPAAIKADTKLLSVQLSDGQVVQFQQRRSSEKDASESYWFGDIVSDRKQRFSSAKEVDVDPMEWISISRYGERLVGSIHVRGNTYQLASVGDGRQLAIKNTRALALECKPLVEDLDQGQAAEVLSKSNASQSVIRVLVVSTTDARLFDIDVEKEMRHALETATSIYQSSGVNVRFEYAQHVPAIYSEAVRLRNMENILRDFRNPETLIGLLVDERRTTNQADIVLVVTSPYLSWGKTYRQARKDAAFALIPASAGGFFEETVIHQIAHLFGASHGWYPGDPIAPSLQYRHGYTGVSSLGKFSTIMAHGDCNLIKPCDSGPLLVHRFSDPNAQYNGAPMGTEENNNVVRLLNEQRERISNFYP
ncbi:hypothetical protein [Pseudomonas mosselii]|uniref:Peptidyl-Asp metalloendopeptidase n=1 Tax=Pseudomonas mosselii TaxID=78327 RepID=A0AA42UMZ5_9PSED|nr:hypothetical protein [Pseudomonas mosselii]MDH1628991.1 hypothetical protein [Pseudomonas mosselii]